MSFLARLLSIEITCFLLALSSIMLFKMVTGKISLAGLLRSKSRAHAAARSGVPAFSPARLQLLILTVTVAVEYLQAIVANPHRDALPALPPSMVAALGGSQAIFLIGKAFSTLLLPLYTRDRSDL